MGIQLGEVRASLQRDGYVVVEGLLPTDEARELRRRVQGLLDRERQHPPAAAIGPDPGPLVDPEDGAEKLAAIWQLDDEEHDRLVSRVRSQRVEEFDTPWPVPSDEVCISFIHIPTFFDKGRSQRVFNLINKDAAFAPLLEHPLVLDVVDAELGRDAVLLDVSINHVGPGTGGGGWHVDSPMTHMPEPYPAFTLSLQSVWMLDDFAAANGATHVGRGSHLSLRGAPRGQGALDDEVVLEGPAGSLAIWYSQTWHRHGTNVTGDPRCGLIVQYGRSWVKPFVDLHTPLTAEAAARFSPRLRYMMGCNAHAPVRG
jgi:ectoine hydroxylase-related dioxygenase (phytanoyl-CoA dioxygenase family)